MAEYVYLDNYSKKGKVGISNHVFDQLVTMSLLKVKGISKSQKLVKKNQFIRLNRPVQTYIRKDIVNVLIYIDIAQGKDAEKVVEDIKREVHNSLLLATEQVPVNIEVKVESII